MKGKGWDLKTACAQTPQYPKAFDGVQLDYGHPRAMSA